MTSTQARGAVTGEVELQPSPDATGPQRYIKWFGEIDRGSVEQVGGKGANLGEMTRAGLPVPPGFVVTTAAYEAFLDANELRPAISELLAALDVDDAARLRASATRLRALVNEGEIPDRVREAVVDAYVRVATEHRTADAFVAVRSSATAEDAAGYSFAGMFESFLNIHGVDGLLRAVQECWASTFGERILFYRVKRGLPAGMSIGVVVQLMVASEKSGVMFTVDPATRDSNRMVIEAAWGLGEVVVAGQVTPDRYVVEKGALAVVQRTIARKDFLLTRDPGANATVRVELASDPRQTAQVLSDEELRRVAELGRRAEAHYGVPQDVEFAIADGVVFLTQTRPITTLGGAAETAPPPSRKALVHGLGASPGIASGAVRVLEGPSEGASLLPGEVLVAAMTSPDWVPVMRRAAAIVTDAGGMTSHASIVSRELGIPCVVGTGNATARLTDGLVVTVDGTTGTITEGRTAEEPPAVSRETPSTSVSGALDGVAARSETTATRIYVNLAQPERAAAVAALDVDGVGLLRAEFLLTSALQGIHPRALITANHGQDFVRRLSDGLRVIAGAFHPRPVVYRATDFRSNEFRRLVGGDAFEPAEENPMIGYRGCYRYTREPDLFALELEALALVRGDLPNLHLMIPFVRTLSELRECVALIDQSPLRTDRGLRRWIMAEVPSVVYWLDEYARLGIHGVSIGSNDLTQLVLGVDRDSAIMSPLFDERDPAVLDAIRQIIEKCRRLGLTSSICGQAPSVHPEYAALLVKWGIDSISVDPDVVERTRHNVAVAERAMLLDAARAGRSLA
jgi:pyruvate,water dikinase